jgi:amidase
MISCTGQKKETNESGKEFKYLEADIVSLQEGYKDGSFTIKEVVQAYLDRIEEIDQNGPALHSVIFVNPDAIEIAEALDNELNDGKARGPMHGIPVILKDNIDTHDKMPCTAGSRVLANSFPLQGQLYCC